MTFDNVVCPHCGYRSEDDELCVACGKLLYEDDHVAIHNVSTPGFLGSGLRSLFKSIKPLREDELEVKEDLEFCPSWSFLSNNVHNDDHD